MYQIDLFVPVNQQVSPKELLAQKLDIAPAEITHLKVIKKSLDARDKKNIHWIYRISFETGKFNENFKKYNVISVNEDNTEQKLTFMPVKKRRSVTVIGMGPAGIFCALSLAASGIDCTIVERGSSIEKRVKDVNQFLKDRLLNEESNIQFGEGGAGTFSDGKLTARTKHPYYSFVIDAFIKAGAPEEIGYLSKPHIGTDRLRKVIINLRKRLIELGVKIGFEEKLENLIVKDGIVKGVVTNKREIKSDFVVLAIGYSAADTLKSLMREGLYVEPKGFAMGYRLEIPQVLINTSMYGKNSMGLPPAEFFFTKYFPEGGFSVYTFCMCPGGMVVPACSTTGRLVLNGMSKYKRDGVFGNAAIVISYNPKLWHNEITGGLSLQEKFEREAFVAGGGNYDAPCATVMDFVNKRNSFSGRLNSSYPFSLKTYPIWEFYSENYVYFKQALLEFGKKIKGLISNECLLIAPETRTSSPYRITRDENFMSVSLRNLFPCGEGAGYSGGIITSAIDGLKVAEKIKSLG